MSHEREQAIDEVQAMWDLALEYKWQHRWRERSIVRYWFAPLPLPPARCT